MVTSGEDGEFASVDQSAVGLPFGCRTRELTIHADARGALAEAFRNHWFDTPKPARWISLHSQANVLRGVCLHTSAWTYLCMLHGRAYIGLHDLRPAAPTAHHGYLITPDAAAARVIAVPPGIAYGLYFPHGALHLSATSASDPADTVLQCRWNCPELKIDWPCTAPLLEPSEMAAQDYASLSARYLAQTSGATA